MKYQEVCRNLKLCILKNIEFNKKIKTPKIKSYLLTKSFKIINRFQNKLLWMKIYQNNKVSWNLLFFLKRIIKFII